MGDEPEEIATPTRTFSWRDVMSGLPDDSRKEEERRIRELQGRVKAMRAVVADTPGLAEILQSDRQRAMRFYARHGIAETMLRSGVTAPGGSTVL